MSAGKKMRWPILLPLIMLVILALACNVTSGGDDDEDDRGPTKTNGTAVGEANIPTIMIQAPDDGAQVLVNSDVLVFAIAEDPIGVTRVELLVNNFVVASQASPDLEAGEQEFEVLLKWQPRSAGTQRLEVIPWRGNVRGEPAVLNLVVRASSSEITQTAGPTLPFVTATQVQDRTCRVQVAVGGLSVRSGPGLVYDIIDRVTIGQTIPVTGRQLYPDAWWQVYYNGRWGWVSGYYVNQLGDCAGIGIILPPPTPTLAPSALPPTVPPTNTPLPPTPTLPNTSLPVEPCRIRVNQDGAPVFTGPGGNYTRMTLLSAGQQFSVVARNASANWWQIALAGTYGWVQTDRTTLIGGCGTVPIGSIPPTPTATNTPAPRPTKVPNRNPRIRAIADQQMAVNEGLALPLNISDPDGDPISAVAESNAINVVTANIRDNVLSLQANESGTATITVYVTDGLGGTDRTQFNVTVARSNRDPQIEAIPDQQMNIGEGTALPINATDPDNDPLTVTAESSDPNIVSVNVDGGNLILQANARGNVTITVRVEDSEGNSAQTSFNVTVARPNQQPQIVTIENQRLNMGEGTALPINATDPDNDLLTAAAESSDPNIVSVNVDGMNLILQANAPGDVTITVTVEDGQGGTAQTQFNVRVRQPNQQPQIVTIENQRLNMGEGTALPINATDPDNDLLTAAAESSDPNIVSVNVDGMNLMLQANAPGDVTITVTVEDGQGGTAQTQFNVRVRQPNQQPQIVTIENQRLNMGEGTALPINATDPDNDLLTAAAESSDPNIVSVNVDGMNLMLQANAPGDVTITVTVEDGQGGTAQTQFNVTVRQPNQQPQIVTIENQRLNMGEGTALPINATDPDNDPLTAAAESSDPNIVSVNVDGMNLILQANAPGDVTITVTVEDGQGGTAQTQFNVRVRQPNQQPQIVTIENQRLNMGEGTALPINATDPDNDLLTAAAESSDPNIVSVNVDGMNLILQANAPGDVTITVTVEDGQGGTAQTQFNVTVRQPNQQPQIVTIENQRLNMGEGTALPINATDPDNDPLTVTAESSDPNIVSVNVDGMNLMLQANAPGDVTITVTVEDGQGGTAQTVFNVTVQQPDEPPPPSDGGNLSEVPLISSLEGDTMRPVRQTYRQGQNMSPPANPGVFSVAGDTPPGQFLGDLADGSANFDDLPDRDQFDDVVFYYASTALPLGGNSFQSGGSLSTNPNWTAANLLDPASADPANCQAGLSPLDCELTVNRPAVIFISVGRNDVLAGTPPNQFRRSLRNIVETSLAQGAIPVLMTIPGLAQEQQTYNNIIVQVAGEYTMPLINVWRQIAETAPGGVNPDFTLTSSGANDQFTPGDLSNFGVPNRNLLVLRMLAQLRAGVPIP